MDLSKFEIFLTVAKTLSFTQAAKLCHLTPSAISKHIRTLEDQTQTTLFQRTTRKITLSTEGNIFYQQCLRLQKELEDTRELVTRLHAKPKGRLTIASNYCFSKHYLFPIIRNFQKQYPDLEIEIICEEFLPPDLHNKQIDIAIGYSTPTEAGTNSETLFNSHYILCGTPQYFEKHGIPNKLDDLQNHYYINHSKRRGLQHPYLKKEFRGFPLQTALWLDQSSSILAAVKQDLGITHLQAYAIQDEIKSGKLIAILPEHQQQNIPCYLYYATSRYLQPKVRAFVDYIISVFESYKS